MAQHIWLCTLILGVPFYSFGITGCSNDASKKSAAVTAQVEDSTASVGVDELKTAMLEMTMEMYSLVVGIESVEDVLETDDEIGEVFDHLFDNLHSALRNPAALQQLEAEVKNDPVLTEWSDKMDVAMERLKIKHPDASVELDRIMQKHATKLMALIHELADSAGTQRMAEDTEIEAEYISGIGGDFDPEEIKEAMLEMNEDMYEIISGIESVEDVQEADDEISEIFSKLADYMRTVLQNPDALQKMEMEMEQDPKLKEWDEKINTARTELEKNHPDAFAELDKVMQKHSMKMQQVLTDAALRMQERDGAEDGTVPRVDPSPDSAKKED